MQFDEYQLEFINTTLESNSVYILNSLPGTGKSTTIAGKISKICETEPVHTCIAVTFSNRASRDLQSKINGSKASTIHSMMISLLKDSGVKPKVINDWGKTLIMREIVEGFGIKYDTKRELNEICFKILKLINYYTINHSISTDLDSFKMSEFIRDAYLRDDHFIQIYKIYYEFKVSRGLWDYDDLISQRAISSINLNLTQNIKYSFWDEAQDMDILMYNIIEVLFKHTAVVLVGDVFQRIYSFRYSYSYPLEEPYKFFQDRKIFQFNLMKNYRSTNNIVKLFNYCRQTYDGLQAISTFPDVKGSVNIITVNSNVDEGKYVAQEVQALLNSGYSHKDIVVLVRKSSYIKSILEPAFINFNIKYNVVTPQYRKKIYELDINRLFLSILSAVVYEDISYLYYSADILDGIGQKYKENIVEQYVKNSIDFSNKKHKIIESIYNTVFIEYDKVSDISAFFSFIIGVVKKYSVSIYTEKSANITLKTFSGYMQLLKDCGFHSIKEILEQMISGIHNFDSEFYDGVVLTTVFQYKGLESKAVFFADNTYISSFSSEDEGQICYVGLSRAKEKLYVIDSGFSLDKNSFFVKSKIYNTWQKTKQILGITA